MSSNERDELVDIYDDSMKKIGIVTRYEAHARGAWHLNFHCWVVSHQRGGSILFQVRSTQKPTFPGLLDSTVGGHYKAGERFRDVVREVREEIGIRVNGSELVPLGRRLDVATAGGLVKKEIASVFFLMSELSPREYRVDPVEVSCLLEIPITRGLKLFSGAAGKITAKGIKWEQKSEKWKDVTRPLNQKSFVPKVDSYYYTLFIMAERFLSGNKYLSI